MAATSVLRASDADRDRAVSALGQHHAVGRLNLEELSERVDAAYRAVTAADLERLFTDLPSQSSPDREPTVQPAKMPVMSCGGSRQRSLGWLLTAVICLAVWAVTSLGSDQVLYFWPMWVIGPWGAVILLARLRPGGR